MIIEAEFLTLPAEFVESRDRLRVVGYELVRYSNDHARAEAAKYRHPPSAYEYAIHKIESVQALDGQIYISRNAFYSSAARVPDWAEHFVEKEKAVGFGLVKQWLKNPISVFLTVVMPPYGLTMLGLAAAGDHAARKEQNDRSNSLARFSELPKLAPRRGA